MPTTGDAACDAALRDASNWRKPIWSLAACSTKFPRLSPTPPHREAVAAPAGPATVPVVDDVVGTGADVMARLGDLYASSFGSQANQGAVAVLPVGPQQQGGGGVSLGTVALLAALGVGGYFVYKRFVT